MKYKIKNGAIVIKGNAILDEINFEVNDKDHIGIVGRNGAGKTTLLKALIDNDMFEEGIGENNFEIQKLGNFKMGYQSQIVFDDENITLLDEIKKSFIEITKLEEKLDKLLKKMEKDTNDDVVKEYSETLERFENLGGYSYKKEYEVMLHKLGFKDSDKERSISSFSGGERTKIAFMRLLLSKPDLLLLDEPTNHLDVEAIEWLEDYLRNYKGAFIIVSHDRMFLNNTVNIIYDISNGILTKYVGNYEKYDREKHERYEKALKDYEAQQKEITRLHALYERFRNKPSKAAMAMSKLHKIEMMDILDKPLKINDKTFNMNMSKMVPSSKNVATLKNITIGYENKEIGCVNFDIQSGERIGIIGANGTGKSTLIKTIAGALDPIHGHIQFGFNVSIGYFDQTLSFDDVNNTVLDEFLKNHSELTETDARKILGAFLFRGNDVFKKISVLSGGEKVALSLCKVLYDKPNFLILDEPTNHMDIVSKERFENILSIYKGTILFVSHDRYFIKKIATRLIVFENDTINYYNGNYDYYLEERSKRNIITQNDIPKKEKIKKDKPINNLNELKKEYKKVEKEIMKLEEKKKEINDEMISSYNDYIKMGELNESLISIEKDLDQLNFKWISLAEKLSDN